MEIYRIHSSYCSLPEVNHTWKTILVSLLVRGGNLTQTSETLEYSTCMTKAYYDSWEMACLWNSKAVHT